MKTSFAISALLYLSFDDVKAMKLAPAAKALAQTKSQNKNLSQLKSQAWNPDLMDDGAWMSPK
jgi:hypothetical protein